MTDLFRFFLGGGGGFESFLLLLLLPFPFSFTSFLVLVVSVLNKFQFLLLLSFIVVIVIVIGGSCLLLSSSFLSFPRTKSQKCRKHNKPRQPKTKDKRKKDTTQAEISVRRTFSFRRDGAFLCFWHFLFWS